MKNKTGKRRTNSELREIRRFSRLFPEAMVRVDPGPAAARTGIENPPLAAWRSRTHIASLWKTEHEGVVRLSVCTTEALEHGRRVADGISWDTLQRIKTECGFGGMDAVEIYPKDKDIIDEANMRHLWIVQKEIRFAWRNDLPAETNGGDTESKAT